MTSWRGGVGLSPLITQPKTGVHPVHDVALRLAERVRQLRQKCDLTQASLASRAGVTVETVARLERVVRGRDSANFNPSLDTLLRLSAALGVDICDLLASKAPPKQRDDRLGLLLRRASPATAQRIYRVAEVLLADDSGSESEPRRPGKRARR
jgi:transcriptional regulator with XRE-family HTH domain